MVPPLKKVIGYWLLVIGLITFLTYYLLPTTYSQTFAKSPDYVRVAILEDAESLRLKVNGIYEIMDSANQKILFQGRDLKTTVTSFKEGILMGEKSFKARKLFIKPDNPDAIMIDNRRFRGHIQLIKKENLSLLVVNHIELEDYIKGILYHEASHYWPQEALKAQAIVCRSYAIYQMQENSLKDYDVTSDIYSQVYGGRISERYRTNKVVSETLGLVLTYKDKYFPTYYHATCGGHTQDALMLWNINIAPLKGVLCNFCQDSPHFKWHNVLSEKEVKEGLTKAGYQIDNIKDIALIGKDASNRIINLKIMTDKKDTVILAKDFRNILGPNAIRSTNFDVKVISRDIVFEGFGWGHGVGLCQWGAYFMAKQGYHYKQILEYYYPHSKISSILK